MKVHDARDGFHDLKPELSSGLEIPWILIFVIILVSILFFTFRKNRIHKDKKTISKTLLEFTEELSQLKESVQLETEGFNLITAKISFLIRAYFADRYRIPVLECTSKEVHDQFVTVIGFSSERSDEVVKILLQLDMISFSEESSNAEYIKSKVIQLIQQAKVLLEKTEANIARKAI